MIICAKGWDSGIRGYSPMIINTKDILYARGCDYEGTSTLVFLRHNVTKETDDGTRGDPIWVVLTISTEEFYKKWKEAEENES